MTDYMAVYDDQQPQGNTRRTPDGGFETFNEGPNERSYEYQSGDGSNYAFEREYYKGGADQGYEEYGSEGHVETRTTTTGPAWEFSPASGSLGYSSGGDDHTPYGRYQSPSTVPPTRHGGYGSSSFGGGGGGGYTMARLDELRARRDNFMDAARRTSPPPGHRGGYPAYDGVGSPGGPGGYHSRYSEPMDHHRYSDMQVPPPQRYSPSYYPPVAPPHLGAGRSSYYAPSPAPPQNYHQHTYQQGSGYHHHHQPPPPSRPPTSYEAYRATSPTSSSWSTEYPSTHQHPPPLRSPTGSSPLYDPARRSVSPHSSYSPTSAGSPTYPDSRYHLYGSGVPGRRKALLIGVNYRGQGPNRELYGCINDAVSWQRFLEVQGWPTDAHHMRLLTEKEPTDRHPTHGIMMESLQWLVRGALPGDALFLSFSGHALQQRDMSGDEADGLDEVLVTVDGRTISDDVLYETLVAGLPQGALLTVVVDSCHSGTVLDLPYCSRGGPLTLTGNRSPQSLRGRGGGGQVVLFSACDDAQNSGDVNSGDGYAGGACTNALLSILGERGPSTTYQGLLEGMAHRVRARKLPQAPQISTAVPMDLHQPFTLTPRADPLVWLPTPPQAVSGPLLNPLLDSTADRPPPGRPPVRSRGWFDQVVDVMGEVAEASQQQYQEPMAPQQEEVYSAPQEDEGGFESGRALNGTKKSLLVGINYRGHSPGELSGCINDVITIQGLLENYGFSTDSDSQRILTEDATWPTRANMLEGFQWLVDGAQPGDDLFFHYSGHGSQMKDDEAEEADRQDETLVPLDYREAGQIRDDDVYDMLVKPLPRGCRLTVVLDCCHSGTGMDLPYRFRADASATSSFVNWGEAPQMEQNTNWDFKNLLPLMQFVPVLGDIFGMFKQNAAPPVDDIPEDTRMQLEGKKRSLGEVIMFSGCKDTQTSADVGNVAMFGLPEDAGPGGAGGACTNALAAVLLNNPRPTWIELLEQMRQDLESKGFKQIPQLSSTQPINLSNSFTLTESAV